MYRYNISDDENEILLIGQMYKRIEQYDEALKIYEIIERIMGKSGTIDVAKAKVFISMEKYEKAIDLLELAQKSFYHQFKIYDQNIGQHLKTLKNRENLSKEEFQKYVNLVAGKRFLE